MKPRASTASFTLVEMLTAIAVLLIILTVIFTIIQQITKVWHNSVGKIENLRDARSAFVAMTHTISQATLNTYYDYYGTASGTATFRTSSNAANFVPTGYKRQSDLHFISGTTKDSSGNTTNTCLASVTQIPYPITHSIFFQAPLGITDTTGTAGYQQLNGMLNACGFYICYGPDPSVPTFLTSSVVPTHYRYRLMQFTQPSEYLSIYDPQTMGSTQVLYNQWFLGPLTQEFTSGTLISISQLAQNVVALVIQPKLSASDQAASPSTILAPNYDYDSRNSGNATTYNQLPPVVEVTMVAIDEASAIRTCTTATPPITALNSPSTLFTTSSNFQTDLNTLETSLVSSHMTFQVFQSEVAMQGAKWSK